MLLQAPSIYWTDSRAPGPDPGSPEQSASVLAEDVTIAPGTAMIVQPPTFIHELRVQTRYPLSISNDISSSHILLRHLIFLLTDVDYSVLHCPHEGYSSTKHSAPPINHLFPSLVTAVYSITFPNQPYHFDTLAPMTMFPASVLTAQEPNCSSPQSNSRRGKPRSARGNKPNRTLQQDGGTESPANNSRSKPRRPRGQGQQTSGGSADNDEDATTPWGDQHAEAAAQGDNSISETGKEIAGSANAALSSSRADPAQTELQANEEGVGASEQSNKKQPKKKGNRAKQGGRDGQSTSQDINQPRHPPSAPAGTPAKQQAGNIVASQSPQPPSSHQVPKSSQNPSRANGSAASTTTPMKFYAGPTFHMSPAPSSLPVPKFFSKSAPQADKPPVAETSPDTVIKTPNESSDDSSGGAREQSPSLKKSLEVENAQAREPSPLDFFFRADRQERARRSFATPDGSPNLIRALSSNSLPQSSRAHSRQPTGGAMFPMELEGTGLPQTPNERHAESAPPRPANQEQSVEEKARAKTEALKQLLQIPPKQANNPSRPQTANTPPNAQMPPDGMLHNLGQTARGNSSPDHRRGPPMHPGHVEKVFQAPPGPNHAPQLISSNTHLPQHAVGQNSPPKAARRHSGRPASSQLRNEVPVNTPVDFSSPSTSTSGARPNGAPPVATPNHSTNPTSNLSKALNTAATPTEQPGYRPLFTSPQQDRPTSSHDDTLRASLARHANISVVSIEDELRRMLNITPQAASAPSS